MLMILWDDSAFSFDDLTEMSSQEIHTQLKHVNPVAIFYQLFYACTRSQKFSFIQQKLYSIKAKMFIILIAHLQLH